MGRRSKLKSAVQHPNPRLPLEVVDIVLSLLFGSPRTLTTCSLACRSFGAISQRYLLSNIVIKPPLLFIDSPPSDDAPGDHHEPNALSRATPFEQLAATLRSSPHLLKHIHTVEIHLQLLASEAAGAGGDSHTQWFRLIPSFLDLLPLITPFIRSFYLSGSGLKIGEKSTTYTACMDWLTFPAAVQRVLLDAANGERVTTLGVGFIMHVPGVFVKREGRGLERIVSQSMIWNVMDGMPNANASNTVEGEDTAGEVALNVGGGCRQPAVLKRMDLLARYSPVLQNISSAMLDLKLMNYIQTLTISIEHGDSTKTSNQNFSNITNVINGCAKTLEHLWLNIFESPSVNWPTIPPPQSFNLASLNKLKSFHRQHIFSIDRLGTITPDPFPAIVGTLSSIDSACPVEIYLDVRVVVRLETRTADGSPYRIDEPDPELFAHLDWSVLNAILSPSALPLATLKLRVMCRVKWAHVSRSELAALGEVFLQERMERMRMMEVELLERLKLRFEDQLQALREAKRCTISSFAPLANQVGFHMF